MVIRERYLKLIRPFYDQELIKVLIGIRRSGKSVILKQIIDELRENNIDDNHIIYINFEDYDYEEYTDPKKLNNYVKEKINDDKKYYIFFDEIQNVDKWEKVVNSLRATKNTSIFITGSNSDLLSSDLATHIAGRYVSFKITPFTFDEVLKYQILQIIEILKMHLMIILNGVECHKDLCKKMTFQEKLI